MAQSINLQITPSGVMPIIYASQFDVGREITFNLYDGATAYIPPAGTAIRFEGKKSDGNGFSYNCTYVDNVVTVALTDQMTVFAEDINCELRLSVDGDDIGTLNVILSVEKSPIDANTPMSDTEIPAIIALARDEQYTAEAWAEGTRNGVPVGPTDPTYNNNAKYYAEHSSASISNLSDTDIQNLTDGQILKYDSVSDKWENVDENLDDVNDVDITSPTDGDALIYDGNSGKWVNGSGGGGGSTTLGGLTDVTLTTPTNNQVLMYDSSEQEWVNGNAPSGGILPHLYITTEADAMVFVRSNDHADIYPTEVSSGHYECDLPDYGIYTIHSDIEGDDATYTFSVDAVKEYHITVMHYTHTINVTVMSGASISISGGGETISGTGTGSSEAFTVHNASTVYTVTTSVDGASAPAQTVTTPAQSEQSTSLTFQYGTINLTFANEFRGLTLTCSSGGTTISKVAPSSGNTMTFYPPTTGTWDISSTIGGTPYYTSAEVTSLSTPVPATLNVRPDGKTVTPTDDISIWLACAGINKNYTTLAEVLADSTTLLALLSDDNACDYLVRSKSWTTANGLVPVMTSNTTPSGEVIATNDAGLSTAYRAFDGDNSTFWGGETSANEFIGYDFGANVTVSKFKILPRYQNNLRVKTFKIQSSSDNSTWNDVYSGVIPDATEPVWFEDTITSDNAKNKRYFRLLCVDTYGGNCSVLEIQFYATTEVAGLCDNATAMTDIGANDYCAETLLSDLIWCNAICNSAHFESVLTIKVPTMTGATTPSGEASAISNYSNYFPWKAFNPNEPTGWVPDGAGQYNVGDWLRYDFVNSVAVSKAVVSYINTGTNNLYFKIQGSKTGNVDDWHDICGEQSIIGVNGQTVSTIIAIPNIEKYRYYRTYETTASLNTSGSGMKVQFYGR